ncbi:class I SAM-dependent methyltransferase [Streptomyces sp. NPDC059168]|uniref:class I SAM-dependent methyltransferase n=1 Tax=Streptomyces sp. NPDC059168 TaxID=3346753 RepID=UPI00367C7CB3
MNLPCTSAPTSGAATGTPRTTTATSPSCGRASSTSWRSASAATTIPIRAVPPCACGSTTSRAARSTVWTSTRSAASRSAASPSPGCSRCAATSRTPRTWPCWAAERGPFDIVIDDGSHLNEHVLTSFEALFPHLRPGGLYVVEDTQTAYWTGWGGNDRDLNDPTTSMGFVKALVDGLNHQERIPAQDGPVSPATRWERGIGAVHVHHNLVVVEKRVNTEQGAPAWVPRDVDPRSWYTAPERSE